MYLSIWERPVRSKSDRQEVPVHLRGEDHNGEYLLSVHSVEGEVGEPMTDEEMQQSWKQIQVLNEELTPRRPSSARIRRPG